MSTSNTGFPKNPFSGPVDNNSAASVAPPSKPPGSTAQGTGSGMLVLPQGETVTIMPSAQAQSQLVTPAVEEQVAQALAPESVRVIPPAAANQVRASQQAKEGILSFDDAIIQEIKTLQNEWKAHPTDEEENDSDKKKKRKLKSRRTKKNDPAKLRIKAQSRFESEQESDEEQELAAAENTAMMKKKKTKKSNSPITFSQNKKNSQTPEV